jgi:hypothetical protein
MTAYLVVNPTASQLTDVDGTTDVPAYSATDAITLTITQLAAVIAAGGAVLKTAPSDSLRHMTSKVIKLGCNPGNIVY